MDEKSERGSSSARTSCDLGLARLLPYLRNGPLRMGDRAALHLAFGKMTKFRRVLF